MNPREEYFARIEPLLGQGLSKHTVELQGIRACARAAEMLAGCRLERIRSAPQTWLCRHLRWKNGFRPTRVLGAGKADASLQGEWIAPGRTCHLEFETTLGSPNIRMRIPRGDRFAWAQANTLAARWILKGLMGRGWPESGRIYLGQRAWPYSQTSKPGPICPRTPSPEPGKHIFVIGLGSLGSEAIRLLRAPGLRWTLVDPSPVKLANPIRQWYGSDEIGRLKVDCLAKRLRGPVRRVAEKLADDGARLRELIAQDRPDIVLLCAGTAEHANLAQVLWEEGLPHVSVLAYPRARFFEVTAVAPSEHTPCLDCYRGRLYKGPQASLPMDEELSSFLYQQVPAADRARLSHELVAEPATPMDTGRIAEVAARLAAELLRRPEARSGWMQHMLSEQTTCLLGGNTVEHKDNGDFAYGITTPGQVLRLGLDDIAGTEAVDRCQVCGRDLITALKLEAPNKTEDLCSSEQLAEALLGLLG